MALESSFVKPLAVNPIKLSAPMGATLAFLGVKECMPLMHGAQGCASFTKVFFTRHYNEPIAIQTTAVNDVTAVFDGGEIGITTAVENITKKVTPKLIGLFSTGLTETKGDDLRGAVSKIDFPIVWVNTPDYDKSFEEGFASVITSLILMLVEPCNCIEPKKITLIPNVSITPLDLEKIKEFLGLMGFCVFALPDLSESLDGFLGQKQGQISSGGIDVDDIKRLGNSELVITIGESVRNCGESFCEKNPNTKHLHFNSLMGLEDIDDAISKLLGYGGLVNEKLKRMRSRYLDAMLDSHFVLGKQNIAVLGESDYVYGVCKMLSEIGTNIACAVVSSKSKINALINAKEVVVGDLEDAKNRADKYDLIIGNFHAIRLAKQLHKNIILRGFPLWESVGAGAICDSLYDGGMRFLFEIVNSIELHHLLKEDRQ